MNTDRKEIFKSRFNEHYTRLCSLAYEYVSDADDSEDIVQELFITIWNKGKDALPDKEFAAYITTAVKNACISFLRKKDSCVMSIEENPSAGACLWDEEAMDDEKKTPEEILKEALSVLPPKCKEIFLLSKLKGMKYKEIAQMLSLSEKTVENQMGKAIKLLREFAATYIVTVVVFITLVLSIITSHK